MNTGRPAARLRCFHLSSWPSNLPSQNYINRRCMFQSHVVLIWPNNPVNNNNDNNNTGYSLVLPQGFLVFYKCLISGMCFCSAVPWSVLIFPFPSVVSGPPPLPPPLLWLMVKPRHWPKDVYIKYKAVELGGCKKKKIEEAHFKPRTCLCTLCLSRRH